jgi:iron-sulfur cluster assembly protein
MVSYMRLRCDSVHHIVSAGGAGSHGVNINMAGTVCKTMSTESADSGTGQTVTVTREAASEALSLIESEGLDTDEAGLRLFVQQGGCAGLSYGMRFDHEPEPDDAVVEQHGLRVFIDPASRNYVGGSTLQYEGGLQGAGFHVENPNIVSECGCGESFRT